MQITSKKVDQIAGIISSTTYCPFLLDIPARTNLEDLVIKELSDILYCLDHGYQYSRYMKTIKGMQESASYNCRIIHAYHPDRGHKFYYRFN